MLQWIEKDGEKEDRHDTRRRLPSHGTLLNLVNVPCPRDVIMPYVAPKIK